MHSIIQNLEVKIYVLQKFKGHKIKNHSEMFRILCDPSSGGTERCLTEIPRSGSQIKFYSHKLMHFLIQSCINLLSYIKIT
jgi:hypothetical protein